MPDQDDNNDQRRRLVAYNIPNMVVFAVLAWSVFSEPTPLKSLRPSAPPSALQLQDEDEKRVPARLWQDPLLAIQKATNEDMKGHDSKLDRVVNEEGLSIASDGLDAPDEYQMVFLVLLDGSPFPEDYEQRLRARRAITDALLESGYQTDSETLGVARVPVGGSKTSSPRLIADGRPVYLAYQTFTPSSPDITRVFATSNFQDQLKKRFDKVHVFFVDESVLSANHEIYRNVTQLLDALICNGKAQPSNATGMPTPLPEPLIHPCVFGPSNSDTFIDLLKDMVSTEVAQEKGDQPRPGHSYANLRFYASAPTIPSIYVQKYIYDRFKTDVHLLDLLGISSKQAEECPNLLKILGRIDSIISFPKNKENEELVKCPKQDATVFRANGDDMALIEGLVEELKLRGADPANPRNPIALISERDGLYGQIMRLAFAKQIRSASLRSQFPSEDSIWYSAENRCDNIFDAWIDARKSQLDAALRILDRSAHTLPVGNNKETQTPYRNAFYSAHDNTVAMFDNLQNPYWLNDIFANEFVADLDKANLQETTDKDFREAKGDLYEWVCLEKARAVFDASRNSGSTLEARISSSLDFVLLCPKLTNECTTNLRSFDYLRGLDGQKATSEISETGEDDSSSSDKSKPDEKKADEEDRPQGETQTDYLRRLAIDLRDVEDGSANFAQIYPPRQFRAIGVVGSDVYDKLLVIRALRREFRAAVFFTTDLDASYLNPSEIKNTAGLVTASRYNLSLQFNRFLGFDKTQIKPEDHPIEASPFRDSYQTALQYACLHALSYHQKNGDEVERPPLTLPPVNIFQVSSSRFIRLSNLDDDQERNRHIPTSVLYLGYLFGFITVFLLLFILLLWSGEPPTVLRNGKPALVGGLLLLGCIIGFECMKWVSDMPDQEPLVLWGWVSTWPSTMIRSIAAVLAGIFIWDINQQLSRNADPVFKRLETIKVNLGNLPGKIIPNKVNGWFIDLSTGLKRFFLRLFTKGLDSRIPCFLYGLPNDDWDAALDVYKSQRMIPSRHHRTIALGVVFAVIAVFAILFGGLPWDPTRGELSRVIYFIVLWLSILFPVYLVFYIVDAMAFCKGLVAWLQNRVVDCSEKMKGLSLEEPPPQQSPGAGPYVTQKKIIGSCVEIIDFIADRTEIVERIIYYPFICLLLLLFARDSNFCRYDWPVSLFVLIPVPYIILGLSVITLQAEAKSARSKVFDLIDEQSKDCTRLLDEYSDKDKPPLRFSTQEAIRNYSAFLARKKEEVNALDSGAYASLYSSPLFQSVLIPLGGVGGIQLITFLKQYSGM